MSLDQKPLTTAPVTSVDELVAHFRAAERRPERFLLGLEHEKLVYPLDGTLAVAYEGERGIGALLQALARRGWQEFREAPGLPVIALLRGKATISLEPGGQLELSGTAAATAREVAQENQQHLRELEEVGGQLGLRFVALGYRPFDRLEDMPWMPKTRYGTMRQTLGKRGARAFHMMLMTATTQVSLDWSDEADCARKVVLAARLTPLLVALCANSPLSEARPAGVLSLRSRVWNDVDPARCGYLRSFFDGSFSYRAYAEWALDAPMLFVRRDGQYHLPRMTFRQMLRDGFQGQPANQSDWVDHLSTLFPEVRIKQVLELRGCDSLPGPRSGALAALARGIFYDSAALAEAEQLLPRLSLEEHLALHATAQERGLEGHLRGQALADLVRELVEMARRGLSRLDPADLPELEPLVELARTGRSPAALVLEAHQGGASASALLDACRA